MATKPKTLMDPNEFVLTKNIRSPNFEETESFKAFVLGIQARMREGLPPIVQPGTWYMHAGRKYVFVGHRRVAAAKQLGIKVPMVQVDTPESEVDRIFTQLAENDPDGRESLSPLELAYAFQAAIDARKREREKNQELPELTRQDIARINHKSKSWVTQTMALLEMPEKIQKAVDEDRMQLAVAYEAKCAFKDPGLLEENIDQIIEVGSKKYGSQARCRSAVRRLAETPTEIKETLGEIPERPEPTPVEAIAETPESKEDALAFVRSNLDWASGYIQLAKQKALEAKLDIAHYLDELVEIIQEEPPEEEAK